MKAIRVEQFGEPTVMQVAELVTPAPGPGEVLTRVHAAGVNPVETYIRSGKYAKLPTVPYTPGSDGAGRVEQVGAGVRAWSPGDRVYLSGSSTGTYAEFCLSREDQVHALPATTSFFQGAALGTPYGTAWHGLIQRGAAQPGETVLIHGASGGVGLAAVQFARAAGLTVLGTAGTLEGQSLLREQGVEHVFDHTTPDYLEAIHDLTAGVGVNLILEMLANVNLATDLKLLAHRGRVMVIGSRGPLEINPRDVMMKESDIRGVMLGGASGEELAQAHEAIGTGLQNGNLRPIVHRQYPLAEAPQAHEQVLARGALGKVVLVL